MTISMCTNHDMIDMGIRIRIWSYVVKYQCVVCATPGGYSGVCHWIVRRRPLLTARSKSGIAEAAEKVTGDKSVRMELLSYAILQGVLMGYVIDSIYLSYIPYAVITPAIITVSFAAVAKSAEGDRKMMLGSTVGAAISFNFMLGLITGSLSFVYFLLTLTYAGIAAVIMQLCFKNLKGVSTGHVYQNALSCSFIVAKGLFFLLFGSYDPEPEPQQQQSDK
ncbi:hypothetical protein COOONC_04579 [Cooperia oncophora]